MVDVSLFGGFGLLVDGLSRGASVPRRLGAILAILAVHGHRGIARDRLLHLLWSDGDPERARHALNQSLYALRRLLGVDDAIVGTAQLSFNAERVRTDVDQFERALAARDPGGALDVHRGPLLDGFAVAGAPELERWVDEQRAQFTQRLAAFLDGIARSMDAEGRHDEALVIRRRRAALDPLDATAALALMQTWAHAGDTPSAVQHARVYGELVRQELELEPDPRVDALAGELQRAVQASVPDAPAATTSTTTIPGLATVEEALRVLGDSARRRMRRWVAQLQESVVLTRDWWRRRSRRWKVAVARAAWVSIGLVIVLLAIARLGRSRRELKAPPVSTAVLPFRSTALAADLSFLPAGIVDLLTLAIAERDTAGVVDAEAVHRWWQSTVDGRSVASSDSVRRLARALEARRLVTGTLVGNARQVVIRATMSDQATGDVVGTALANGPLDSLPRLVNRVATLLVAGAAGASGPLGLVPDADPRALRAYLLGRAAYQRADFSAARTQFANALAQDSALASAAIGLALAADWLEDAATRASAIDVARRGRDRLPNVEQQQLIALQGVRWPEPSSAEEHFAAWERVALTGNRPELWSDLGRRLLVDGRLAGLADPEARARGAFARALVLDSTNTAARLSLAALGPLSGSEGALTRQVVDGSAGDLSFWVGWRLAVRSRDQRTLDRVRRGFDSAGDDALRRIALGALSDGEQLPDGERVLRLRDRRAQSTAARVDAIMAEHAYALNAGSPSRALAATRRLEDLVSNGAHLRLRVLDALYGDGDTVAAHSAATRLAERVAGAPAGTDDERAIGLADLCVLEQWRLWRGEFGNAEASVRALTRDPSSQAGGPVVSGSAACGYLVEAIAAGLRGSPAAGDALQRAERLALSGPSAGDLRQYATLALARVRERRGDVRRASELADRRSESRGWPRYLASYLQLEATLAERLQDTVRARAALRHYVALRAAPDSSGAADADLARARLRRLDGHS